MIAEPDTDLGHIEKPFASEQKHTADARILRILHQRRTIPAADGT
jgi:hypothetical protein